MLKLNKILSKKGFSLIELMVAVAILVMAIFVIFLAYSTGFMGMAESKDRTEAVNYVRQALEDVKNMDFEEVIPMPRTTITGTKYEKEVFVTENVNGSLNLKEILARVYWQDRDGNNKQVETSMLITRMELLPEAGTRILLYVYPYNVVYPVGDSAQLTAVIKDAKGNTDYKWNKDIKFSITSMSPIVLGYLEEIDVTEVTVIPEDGIAHCTFFSPDTSGLSSNEIGVITIKAEVPDDSSVGIDTVEILATWGAVRVELEAHPIGSETPIDPPVIIDPGDQLDIYAFLKNAQDGIVTTGSPAEIDFNLTGEGSLEEPLTRMTDEGEATILYSTGENIGNAKITGSSTNLYSGSINIFIAGAPYAIDLNASSNQIFTFESSTLTIILKDINGLTVNNPGPEPIKIDLSILSGSGSFAENQVSIATGASLATTTFTPSSSGQVNIQASDNSNVLLSDTATISVNEPLEADHIEVSAKPTGIKADSGETSKITAIIKSESPDNLTVTNYNQPITFTTTMGSFSSTDSSDTVKIVNFGDLNDDYAYQNGGAWVTLYANNVFDSGTATITASSNGIDPGQMEFDFYVEASYILLYASDTSVNLFGNMPDTCTVTAEIKDSDDSTVLNYVGEVTFSIASGSEFGGFTTTGDTKVTVIEGQGKAEIDFRGKCETGTVEISAVSTYGLTTISSSENLSIYVLDESPESIKLVDDSVNLFPAGKGLEYYIGVEGGDLRIYNMSFLFNGTAKISELRIDDEPVYYGSIGNGDKITILPPTLLETGNHKIEYITGDKLGGINDFETIFNDLPCDNLTHIIFDT